MLLLFATLRLKTLRKFKLFISTFYRMYNYLIVFLILYNCDTSVAVRKYTRDDILKLREEVRDMFQHAYDGYLQHAFPYDELRPLSCDGVDTWGSYSLTLIDALDTLAIMGNYTEFNRVVNIVLQRQNFDADINVSVFETNIRIVGGLLSAHLLSHKTGMDLEPGWPCNGPLLRLAEDVAQRLIAAFDTTTGMPYGTINLRSGVPPGETSITCTAGVGTFIVEFGTLSRLTGDPLYEEVALNALMALYNHRSPIGLLGNHIDVMSGRWTAQDAGIGGGVDSYYEYLVKGAILLERPELMAMFHEARAALERYVRKEDWYVWASMGRGQVTLPVFQSLDAYWPGVLAMAGDVDTALRVLHSQHSVWRQYGFTPEAYHLGAGEAAAGREGYPLRPELVESLMVLLRQSRDPALLPMAEDVLRSLQHSARTGCGYATIKDVRDHRKEDRMESFFLAETTKYLYLIFDPDNFIHNPGVSGKTIQTPKGECLIDFGGYIFNTEAHPIDPALLACCHEHNQGVNISEVHRIYQILEEEDNVQFMTMIEASTADNVTDASVNQTEVPTEVTAVNVTEPQLKSDDNDSNQAIKTETKTGYVNLDGSEREKVVNESTLSDIVKERIIKYYNSTHVKTESNVEDKLETVEEATVEVDDIVVPQKAVDSEKLQLPSSSKAKEAFKMLPTVLQEFLNREWKTKPKCEPQHMLERIRKEKKYSPHPDENKYELLLTPAPSFLQRISLAGEFLSKKQLEL